MNIDSVQGSTSPDNSCHRMLHMTCISIVSRRKRFPTLTVLTSCALWGINRVGGLGIRLTLESTEGWNVGTSMRTSPYTPGVIAAIG